MSTQVDGQYGPNTPAVETLIEQIRGITPEQLHQASGGAMTGPMSVLAAIFQAIAKARELGIEDQLERAIATATVTLAVPDDTPWWPVVSAVTAAVMEGQGVHVDGLRAPLASVIEMA